MARSRHQGQRAEAAPPDRGQLHGLQRTVEEDVYCIDVLTQVYHDDHHAAEHGGRAARRASPPLRRRRHPLRRCRRGGTSRHRGESGDRAPRPIMSADRAHRTCRPEPEGDDLCVVSSSHVEKTLNRLDGVLATVNFATETAAVDFDPTEVTRNDLVAAVVHSIRSVPAVAARPPPRTRGRGGDALRCATGSSCRHCSRSQSSRYPG